jgi:hypothetical protein
VRVFVCRRKLVLGGRSRVWPFTRPTALRTRVGPNVSLLSLFYIEDHVALR